MTDVLLRNVTLRTMRDARRALVGYCVGLAILVLMMGAVWPTIAEQGDEFQKLLESYPPAMQAFFGDMSEFTTPAGYLRGELFSAMLPLVLLLFAIGRTADVLAGEEERGGLDALVAHPITRRRAYLEKAAGVAVGQFVIIAVVGLSVAMIDLVFAMGIPLVRVASASLMLLLLGLAMEGVTLALAGWRGRKGLVISLASAFAVASYLLSSLGNLVDELKPARVASIFAHYGDTNSLAAGVDGVGAAVLLAVGLAGLAIGLWAFERRDLAV